MRTRLLAAIAASLALLMALGAPCRAMTNMFNYEYERIISTAKLERRLSNEFKPSVQEVARLLAQTQYKFLPVFKAVKVSDLLEAAELLQNDYISDCYRARFERYETTCEKAKVNVYLSKYCDHCMRTRIERCSEVPLDSFIAHLLSNLPIRYGEAIEFSRRLMSYIKNDGEESYPEAKNVKQFMRKRLALSERLALKAACNNVLGFVEDNLKRFHRGDEIKRAIETAMKAQSAQGSLLRRCQLISTMAIHNSALDTY